MVIVVVVYRVFVKTNIVLYCGDTAAAAAVDTQDASTTVTSNMHLIISIV